MEKTRFASTVILIRRKKKLTTTINIPDTDAFQIYTMKRPQTMRSFQNYTVFPGGLLEPQDDQIEWKQYIHNKLSLYEILSNRFDYPERTPTMNQMENIPELPYVIAAIREVFEETGILLCQSENSAHKLNTKVPTLQLYRQALLNKEITFIEMIKKIDIKLDVSKLLYIGRRVTPPPTPVFFDTNFYLTIIPTDTVSIPSEKEVASDNWIDASTALKLVEQKEITCAPVTIECFYKINALDKPLDFFSIKK